jgi:hypothetical protein
MNFAAAGAANMYEARNLGDVRCEVTESTIPAAGKSKRYRPETFLDASFEDLFFNSTIVKPIFRLWVIISPSLSACRRRV